MNPFRHTQRVAIELSNLCNYAWFHKRCPLHRTMASPVLVQNPTVLPAKIVYHVLDSLGQYDYAGLISFHDYNEPLIDPRLFLFIRYAKMVCPDCRIYIITNGHYLDQVMAGELVGAGVSEIIVSMYGSKKDIDAKQHRFEIMARSVPAVKCEMRSRRLDDRMDWYSHPKIDLKKPCGAPIGRAVITKKAELALCCYDWKRQHTFGNLYKQSLEEIFLSDRVLKTYGRLQRGDRFLDLCRRCKRAKGI